MNFRLQCALLVEPSEGTKGRRMNQNVLELDAVGQSQAVRAGHLTAEALIEATIAQIRAFDARLSFMTSDCFEDALRRARANESRDGPLFGVGLLIKDLIPFPGMKLEYGSRLFAGQVSSETTPYTSALSAAGLVGLGRTTTSELGLLGSTESRLTGATLNPWDTTRSAGGSSGGAAVAVACRAVPFAHATDGGGSIRIPAGLNGVFGLKPSRGRTWESATIEGPLAPLLSDHCVSISVRDSAALLAVTERTGPAALLPPVGLVAASDIDRLRVGVYCTTLTGEGVSPEVTASLTHTVRLLESLHHEVHRVPPPAVDGHQIGEAFFILAGMAIAGLETALGLPLDDAVVEPFTLALRDWYRSRPAGAVERARGTLAAATAALRATIEPYDVLLSPTTPLPAPPLGYLAPDVPWPTAISSRPRAPWQDRRPPTTP